MIEATEREQEVVVVNRTPPENIEAEKSTLGSMMLSKDAIADARQLLNRMDFRRAANQEVFDVICTLADRDDAVDPVTMDEELHKRSKQGLVKLTYLMALVDSVPTAHNVGYYAKIVKDMSMARDGIEACIETIALLNAREDPVELLSSHIAKAAAICDGANVRQSRSMVDLLNEVIDSAQEAYATGKPKRGYDAVLQRLNNMTNGLYSQQLVCIGGQPSTGKTAYTMNVLCRNAQAGIPGAIYTAETGGKNLCQRILATYSGVRMAQIRSGALSDGDWAALHTAADEIARLPLYIEECAGWHIGKVIANAKRHIGRHGVKLVALDYLQLVQTDKQLRNEDERLADLIYKLKSLSQAEDVCVLALSSFNRDYKTRSTHKPTRSDFRGSGSIEYAADIMLALWRPAAKDGEQSGDDDAPIHTEFCLLKQKDGPTGDVQAEYNGSRFRFADTDHRYEPPARAGKNDHYWGGD